MRRAETKTAIATSGFKAASGYKFNIETWFGAEDLSPMITID